MATTITPAPWANMPIRTGIALREPFVLHGWGAVVSVIGLIIVSFTGFEKVSTMAEEIKNPSRNLPLAIVGSVVMATALYALILFVAIGLVSAAEIDPQKGLLIQAANRAAGPVGETVMLIAALLATLSSANAAIMASSRISYGMGRDRVLPGWFSYAHPKLNTPAHAILFTGGLGTLLAMTGQAETLAEISSALFMVSYVLLCTSVIVMRGAKRRWYQPSFRTPLYPVLPVVTGLLCLSVILTMEPFSRAAGVGLMALSLLWYNVWVRKQAVVIGEIGPLWERERPLEGVIEAAEAAVLGGKNEVLIPLLEESLHTAKAIWSSYDEAKAMHLWKLFRGDEELMAAPRLALVRSLALNHWYHHRGQLSVYLRLLDASVPATYGPSADEDPFG